MRLGRFPLAWLFLPLANLIAAAVATALLFFAIGVSPVAAFASMLSGAFGSSDGIGYTLFYTTDFIFTGLAVALPYRAGLFNIGAEGQTMIGGIAVALVCRAGAHLGWLTLPLAVVAAPVGGALWALPPAILEARRGGTIVITTIMFNFLAAAVSTWMLVDVIRAPGDPSPETAPFPIAAALPVLSGSSPVNVSLILAVALALGMQIFLQRTCWGFELDVVGKNEDAARYAGIPIVVLSIAVVCLGGGLAGLMAVNELLGTQHRLVLGFSAGFGFIGIAVAFAANCQPAAVIASAFLFGALYQGGTELALDTPKVSQDVIMAINGLAVLVCGALSGLWRGPLDRLRPSRRAAPAG